MMRRRSLRGYVERWPNNIVRLRLVCDARWRRLSDEGNTQDSLITVRGERFVIPVKAEFKRKVGGVVHGSSSSGQTVFIEPLETIEHNNELTRLLDEEQAEIHRILVAMTRTVAGQAEALLLGARSWRRRTRTRPSRSLRRSLAVCGRGLPAKMRFLQQDEPGGFQSAGCAASAAGDAAAEPGRSDRSAEHCAAEGKRQLIISGPNTGGKTVALKTAGLLTLMAQAGIPVPAASARLPLFTGVYADIGDAQSIEQNLSTFSAHVLHLERIAQCSRCTVRWCCWMNWDRRRILRKARRWRWQWLSIFFGSKPGA